MMVPVVRFPAVSATLIVRGRISAMPMPWRAPEAVQATAFGVLADESLVGWGRAGSSHRPNRRMVGVHEVEHDASGLLLRSPGLAPYRIPAGVIVGSVSLTACVPILDVIDDPTVEVPTLSDAGWLVNLSAVVDQCGNFDRAGWLWMLDNAAPSSVRCPACVGTGNVDRHVFDTGARWNYVHDPCQVCQVNGRCSDIRVRATTRLSMWDIDVAPAPRFAGFDLAAVGAH